MSYLMNLLIVLIIFLLQLFNILAANNNDDGGGGGGDVVKALTFSDFMPTLENNNNVLVEFYAPWCGHCKALEPEFKAAAEQLQKESVDCLLAKVDATAEDMLAGFFSVKAFPTIKFFQNSVTPVDYTGGRTTKEIYQWVKAAVAAGAQGRSVNDVIKEAANKARKVQEFEGVMNTLPKLNNNNNAGNNDNKKDNMKKKDDVVDMKTGIEEEEENNDDVNNDLPPVLSFPSNTLIRLLNREISIKGDTRIVFLIWKAESENSIELGKRFDEIATKHRKKSLFIGIDSEDSKALKYFKIPRTELPAARAIDYRGQQQRFKLNVPTLEDDVDRFISNNDNNEENKLIPYFTAPIAEKWSMLKSETENETKSSWFKNNLNDDGNTELITTVNGDTFKANVIDEQVDVIMMVYADWCSHCKSLKPKFVKLANDLKSISTIRVMAMNGDKNEVHGLDVKAFPEIYLFPALNKDRAVPYDGPRNVRDIHKFLQEKVSYMFTLKKNDGDDNERAKDVGGGGHDEL